MNDVKLLEILVVLALVLWGAVALLRHWYTSARLKTPSAVSGNFVVPEDDEATDEEILSLSWLSKTDTIESRVIVKVNYDEDIEWNDGILTAVSPEDKRITLTCPPHSALVFFNEGAPTEYDEVEYLLTLKDGDTILGEWKIFADSDGPDLTGNYWWATDEDGKTQIMVFAGRELTFIAREI